MRIGLGIYDKFRKSFFVNIKNKKFWKWKIAFIKYDWSEIILFVTIIKVIKIFFRIIK